MTSKEALSYLDDIAHGREMKYDPHDLAMIIKQDLEVLEILKNKNVDIYLLGQFKNLKMYNDWVSPSKHLTKKEYDKVINWLERE